MALDPSIILGVKSPNLAQPDPLERFSKLAGIEKDQMVLEEGRRKIADEAASREAFKAGGSESEIFNRLLQVNPTAALAYRKQMEESRGREATTAQHTATAGKANWEVKKQKAERGAAMLAEAKDQASFEQIVRMGVINETWDQTAAEQMLARGYSPDNVRQWQAAGLDFAKQQELQGQRETRAQTQANAPFTAGPGGVPVPNQAVQDYERSRLPGDTPHYDTDRGIVVYPRTGVGTPITVGGQPVGGKPDKDAAQRKADSQAVVDIARQALPILEKASSGFLESGIRTIGQAFGATSEAAKADAELKVLAGALVSKMPKMSGPQSDKDVLLYQQMAGELGDSTKPIETRKAALRGLLRLQKTYGTDVPQELLEDPKPAGRGGAPAPGGAPGPGVQSSATATGTGPTLRVPPGGQAQADNETAGMLAQTKTPQWLTENIANNTAALNDPKNKNMKPEHRNLIARELEAYKRALEIQRGTVSAPSTINPSNLSNAEIQRELNRTR